jgi:hypothetical protein
MIIPGGSVDKVMGVHLQKVHKINNTSAVDSIGSGDSAMISKFSTLVELGRKSAMSLPNIRTDRVEQAQMKLGNNESPEGTSIASAMINAMLEGQV